MKNAEKLVDVVESEDIEEEKVEDVKEEEKVEDVKEEEKVSENKDDRFEEFSEEVRQMFDKTVAELKVQMVAMEKSISNIKSAVPKSEFEEEEDKELDFDDYFKI